MDKKRKGFRKVSTVTLAALMVGTFAAAQVAPLIKEVSGSSSSGSTQQAITALDSSSVETNKEAYFDTNAVTTLSSAIQEDEEISLIVMAKEGKSLLDAYDAKAKISDLTVGEYAATSEGRSVVDAVLAENSELRRILQRERISYKPGYEYSTLFTGFEIVVKAKDFPAVEKALGNECTVVVSEVYEKCETELVTNDVNVYETGIFDSSDSDYDGSGVVVAVLDTGCDYTHSAFSMSNFTSTDLAMTKETIAPVLANTRAASLVSGLTVEDVYYNDRIPYQFDYADFDADVFPIESEHGTHVSGIIVGKDDVITGVAPNAQLVPMKVFSDVATGAKNSWILAAVEDCAVLGVDVVNMSLGSACGFAREKDNKEVNNVYDRLKERGISLVVAASNSYNSTHGSTKNGNLGLTSNPDSATVGSPATYSSALSVASISGTKTPYILYNDTIIYFNEASDASAKPRSFVNEILPEGVTGAQQFEYVTIKGIGITGDYTGLDVKGKIVLVKRGQTTFEDKAKVAENMGAAGIIIYNNVSGDISMTVGRAKLAVCSISQEYGELLAAQDSGIISLGRDQVAGPFMSDFSSWGPGPDLTIKPEITAHGGDILSAVPGQGYDRLSGTSMASPNQAGVTALIRQYVKETFSDIADDPVAVTERVNQIMMSTTDIAYNTNGLPYAVRKQGSGLANLGKATSTPAYVTTFDKTGEVMDKTKLELGDDPQKTGVYTMTFAINNIAPASLSYQVDAIVMTEGVSDIKTHQGDTTVTEKGYVLDGATVRVTGVNGGTADGNKVTVSGNGTAVVTVTVTLSDSDKDYLDKSFKNGMYVEGFVTLEAEDGTEIDLNVPYLAFYGDWSQAPIFDLDYFETNKDELDDSIDTLDKTMADAYATTPIGGLYSDYINHLGAYYYIQDPTSTKISASREHVSLSNQEDAVNSIYGVWAGLLRNAKYVDIVISEDATGEVIFSKTEENVRKSYTYGASIRPASIDVGFNVADYNLKNNTKYNVKLTARLDYENDGLTTNAKNTFEFPFVTDFEAPAVTGVEYYTEYEKSTKTTRLYAKLSVYDNHYAMAAQTGYIYKDKETDKNTLSTFGRYLTPIYSSFNSESYLTIELTDYLDQIKQSTHPDTFVVVVYDYALNQAIYEIPVPSDIKKLYFPDEEITLSPNETYILSPEVFPEGKWSQLLDYTSSVEGIVNIVNGKLVAVAPGTTVITATCPEYNVSADLKVTVLAEGDPGYRRYDKPVADSFEITGYYTNKAFYIQTSADREIGLTGSNMSFGKTRTLSMYPSESVTVQYLLKAYFPEATEVVFSSGNDKIATVDENGTIVALAEGGTSVSIRVYMDGKSTAYGDTVYITVKNPYTVTSSYLTNYRGLGGEVILTEDLTLTQISQYAFSNYHSVEKDLSAGDVIDEEDPYNTKIAYLGENETVTKVVIPEGVELIDAYAFAGLAALEEVVLPSTLKKINQGAFLDCNKLSKVTGLEHVQFINQDAFANCALTSVTFENLVALGNRAFMNNRLESVELPDTAQSIGIQAFSGNETLSSLVVNAEKVKLGAGAFKDCAALTSVNVNAAVISESAFEGCTDLEEVTLGKDVALVSAYAFAGTKISRFTVDAANQTYRSSADGSYLVSADGTTILLVAPNTSETFRVNDSKIKAVGDNAFSGNGTVVSVSIPTVRTVGAYAFAQCSKLSSVTFGGLTEIGAYAFFATNLTATPDLSRVTKIGERAFSVTPVRSVTLAAGTQVGAYAFGVCPNLTTVVVGDDCILEEGAFFSPLHPQSTQYECYTSLTSVTIGKNVDLGTAAFYGADLLSKVTLGEGAKIGDHAFYYTSSLAQIDLSEAVSIGSYAFAGRAPVYSTSGSLTGYYIKASKLTSVDLSSAEFIGEGAFMDNKLLETVVLGEKIDEIGAGVFINTAALKTINLENVTTIGLRAFSGTGLEEVDLSGVDTIGYGAFALSDSLAKVVLKEGVKIGGSAFEGAGKLATVENLGKAVEIGNYAFAETALTSADLSSAVLVGDFAFANTPVTQVTLGAIRSIGENPFANCDIPAFTKTVEKQFNNETYTEEIDDFELSESVFVEDGVLYRKTSKGYVLVCYPTGIENNSYAVKEGTVRISAQAFSKSPILSVELPVSLEAIGDKAFYQSNISFVVFKSVVAPVLEEEYDLTYQYELNENGQAVALKNLAFTGTMSFDSFEVEGLGIVPFYMWTFGYNNVYFGASFYNYIGHIDRTIIMVRPENGEQYGSFIYKQYFAQTIDGNTAPYPETLSAIEAIDRIPSSITLNDKAVVVAARAAYDKLTASAQQALVTNYNRLTSAESVIKYLEEQENVDPPQPIDPVPSDEGSDTAVIVLSVLTGVFAACTVAAAVYIVLDKCKGKKKSEEDAE